MVPDPQVLTTGVVTTVSFAVPNERPEPMSGVTISVPTGVGIVRAHPLDGWAATIDGSTSTWRGGSLAHLSLETFRLDVEVTADLRQVTLTTLQLYPSGATVSWPATVTVLPGREQEPSQTVWALAAVVGGLLVTALFVLVAWRRRMRTLLRRKSHRFGSDL